MRIQEIISQAIGGFLLFVIFYLSGANLFAQQLAFPGAEGFGRYASGGRGGSVYHVTNLNDTGTGSFRDAVSQSYRTVVFDVGGIIYIGERIVIHHDVTVAGQTAPGDGILIYGNGIALNDDSGNNIIRYIRIRMGKNGDSGKDAVGISAGQNYMFDHVSISWGRDGTLDVNGTGIDNLTFQDCIIAQGINNTNHSTGGLMQSGKWSMIRSLYIDNKTRNPKARGTHEFINSVLYNWDEHGYIMGDTEGLSECNLIGNYFIYGPSSNSDSHITGTTSAFHVYPEDNWVDSDKDGTLDGSLLTNYKTATVETTPYSYPGVNNQLSAQNALSYVIQNVGASLSRDDVDELLINQLLSYGTQGQIINTEDDNGISGNVGTVNGGTAPTDTDGDGMPDSWESANGFNPYSADNNGDADSDGYTNLEEYLNSLVGGGSTTTTTAASTTTTTASSTTTTTSGSGVTIQENETGFCNVDGTIDNNNSGFTGDGFANTTNATGSGIDWKINVSASGTYTFTWRYANGSSDRPGNLLINGSTAVSNISFPGTGSWTTWTTVSTNTTLSTGVKDVRLEATTSGGLANIDYIEISGGNVAAASCNATTTTTAATTTTTTTTTGATTTTTTTSGGGCTCPSLCGSSTTISLPHTRNGAGEYCWVTSDDIGYINSWGLEELNINGQDFTNQWANSFPAKINGNYYIYYHGYNVWSHFEATAGTAKRIAVLHPIPKEFALFQNFPNPFNPKTDISYQLPEEGDVLLEIFDVQGHKVKTLIHNRHNMGYYTVGWNSLDESGKRVTSGVYFYKIKIVTQNRVFTEMKKMILMK